MGNVDLLKVSAWSNPKSVAGAIAGVLRERGYVDVQVIGAAALNQAVKAIAISRSYVASEGLDPICIPGFQDIEIGGEGRTAIRIRVEDRSGKIFAAAAEAQDDEQAEQEESEA
ncbi:MAG: stage V sporulation protein S [Actinobacteria bacterium]|nr:MAG: stage V sporulation protein S [Actinomycetota bacterium]